MEWRLYSINYGPLVDSYRRDCVHSKVLCSLASITDTNTHQTNRPIFKLKVYGNVMDCCENTNKTLSGVERTRVKHSGNQNGCIMWRKADEG